MLMMNINKMTGSKAMMFILTAILGAAVLVSCRKTDVAKKMVLTVAVQYPDGYTATTGAGIKVKVNYASSARTDSATTDAAGKAIFTLPSGIYNITATGETSEFAFNGTAGNVVHADTQTVVIKMHAASLTGGLVIKELYYTGSRTPTGGSYFADQFQEIYNNSDDTIYLDGLAIGSTMPVTSASASTWVDANGNLLPRLPLQGYIAYIPGTGKQHPLAPRKSIVIAQDGMDHKSDPLGNSASPVNLGNADWEYYCGDINAGRDADLAGVPNLSIMFTTSTTLVDQLYSVFGSAYVIFRLPAGTDPMAFATNEANLQTAPGSAATTKYLMLPKEYVIDAVECVQVEDNKRFKRLHAELDAGYTFSEGTYVSQSVRRKVKQIIDGKVIYKDTNNSTEDFLNKQTPTPGVHPTKVD